MKKLFALLLALAMCCALCACGQEKSAASAGTSIPKPTEAASATEAPAPSALPQAEVTPAPSAVPEPTAAPAAAVAVSDFCSVMGKHVSDGGYMEYYSFTLPQVTGADTPYVREINDAVQEIYDDYVCYALDSMEEYDSLPCYCACYQHAETNGIHSLLITCDSDWGMNTFWCFNFDGAGNEVRNADVLKAAGMTEEAFVAAAREFFTEVTDLSDYFEDNDAGWKELQAQTIADDNCNAALPMALLPNGDLCFIGTIYTPAGAGVYDRALEFVGPHDIRDADIGVIFLNKLNGCYQVDAADVGKEEDGIAYLLEFFTVGDTLTAEVTGYSEETGSVMFYYAADIFPDDPAELLRGDVDGVRVRVASYCPDVFAGSYYGEPGVYTLTVDRDGVSFTDFGGGTPLLGGADGFTAKSAYRGDLGVDDPTPGVDYDRFDYDAVEAAGIAGVWSGYYTDNDYKTHSLTLEMTNWGHMLLRDCVDGEIPRVAAGSYYLSGADEGFSEGAVVFNLVARGGYKMPVFGCCDMFVDEEGDLLIDDALEDSSSHLTKCGEDYFCVLIRVAEDRRVTAPQIRRLAEDESVTVVMAPDGRSAELSYSLVRDEDAGDAITGIDILLNGEVSTLRDQWSYSMDVYLIEPGLSGQAFLYFDSLSDNDYHYTQIVGVSADRVWYAGDYFCGFASEPEDVEALRLFTALQFLSTAGVERSYRVGIGGLPEAVEPFFHARGEITLTAKQDIDVWIVAPDSGELVDTATLPAGTEVTLLRSDGRGFWDLRLANGDVRRVWVDSDYWPQTVGGVDIEECFDGVRFAG